MVQSSGLLNRSVRVRVSLPAPHHISILLFGENMLVRNIQTIQQADSFFNHITVENDDGVQFYIDLFRPYSMITGEITDEDVAEIITTVRVMEENITRLAKTVNLLNARLQQQLVKSE
jgi:hypothetical protein